MYGLASAAAENLSGRLDFWNLTQCAPAVAAAVISCLAMARSPCTNQSSASSQQRPITAHLVVLPDLGDHEDGVAGADVGAGAELHVQLSTNYSTLRLLHPHSRSAELQQIPRCLQSANYSTVRLLSSSQQNCSGFPASVFVLIPPPPHTLTIPSSSALDVHCG